MPDPENCKVPAVPIKVLPLLILTPLPTPTKPFKLLPSPLKEPVNDPDNPFMIVPSNCEEPLIIPPGLAAILSHVVCVIEPLKTYLVSYDPVNC